ncbi:hypothetical protein [Xanthomonas translucens]|nr:hypothetical protein [Xanthomonas translucens]MCC8448628.1 hypothetical protein [Xanthomonas translucens pv. translucens]MCT8285404.1 hypothetical protein [Xanthomonas translucens pv. translucens]MCT8303062.1 hypothetical protein [Xanthomonas translucens pv. translucens]QSQ29186.1 hypothetical protein ISN30_12670 [Xanthomonas translucens pv. translucens]UNU00036.1 hypothetical protein KBQ49_05130 [Xanthomonas translucens pv. translucens]
MLRLGEATIQALAEAGMPVGFTDAAAMDFAYDADRAGLSWPCLRNSAQAGAARVGARYRRQGRPAHDGFGSKIVPGRCKRPTWISITGQTH